MKRVLFLTASLVVIAILAFSYYLLESIYYSEWGCGCSSTCTGFYPSIYSKIAGYILTVASVFLIINGLWKRSKTTLWKIGIGLFIIVFATYGNGYMMFNKGVCGNSLNETNFYLFNHKIGDWAKKDAETIDLLELKKHKLDGMLLGYYKKEDDLYVYRIAAPPVKLKTSFMFWRLEMSALLNNISYGLDCYRLPQNDATPNIFEFVGGKDMPIEAFKNDASVSNIIKNSVVKSIKRTDAPDGTTRFYLKI